MSRTARLIERTRAINGVFKLCEASEGCLKVEPVEADDGSAAWEAYIGEPVPPVGYGATPWAAVVELARLLEGK